MSDATMQETMPAEAVPETATPEAPAQPARRSEFVAVEMLDGSLKELDPESALAVLTARQQAKSATARLEALQAVTGGAGANGTASRAKAQAGAPQRTSLVAGRGEYDFKIEVDGVSIYCRGMSPKLEEWVEQTYPQELADALGCDLATTQNKDALQIYVQFVNVPDPDKPGETFAVERTLDDMHRLKEILRTKQVELFDRVIGECVVGWSTDDPISDKLLMPRVIKRQVCDRIVDASQFARDASDLT